MARRIALVTDSTAALPDTTATAHGVSVVPLHVVVGDEEFTEGVDITSEEIGTHLRKGPRVSTSRPSPMEFLAVYERIAAQGATGIVSAHISAQLSGTCEAATLAARHSPVPVRVIDSESTGLALGYAVLDANDAAIEGWGLDGVASLVLRRARATTVVFYVHTLEFLRRGGRIGAASRLLGGALAIKPILQLTEGHVEPVEKCRTAGRALGRLTTLAIDSARLTGGRARIAVHHAGAPDRAERLAVDIARELGEEMSVPPQTVALPAVLAAHLGPGAVAVAVAPEVDGGAGVGAPGP